MSMRTVLHEADISRALTRIAHEILESNRGAENLVLLGIPTRGVTLAHRLGLLISEIAQQSVPVGALDVTLFRDDLAKPVPMLRLVQGDVGSGNDDRYVNPYRAGQRLWV